MTSFVWPQHNRLSVLPVQCKHQRLRLKCLPMIFTRGGLHPLIGAADFFYCCPVVRSNFCWPSKDLVLSSLGTPSTLDLIYAAVPHTDRPPHPISSTNPPPQPLALSISFPLSPPTPDLSSSVRPEIPGKSPLHVLFLRRL